MGTGPPGSGARDDRGETETVRDVVARTHGREGPALVAPERATDYSAREFASGVRKAANLLTHYGAGAGRPVSVAVGPKEPPADGQPGWFGTAADPLFGILGGMVLGAPVDPAPDRAGTIDAPDLAGTIDAPDLAGTIDAPDRAGTIDAPDRAGTAETPDVAGPVDGSVLVAPTAWLDRFEVGPGTSVLAYGGPPTDPSVVHFERERWSENPVEPPEPLEPGQTALRIDGAEWTHQDLVSMAVGVVERSDLAAADSVRVATRVDSVHGLVTGVLAPLVAGTPIQPVTGAEFSEDDRGVFAVAGEERRRLTVEDVA